MIGEEVFGVADAEGGDAAAEYVVVQATSLSGRPKRVTFAESAALPMAAVAAWNALIEVGSLQAGQTVLIRGGATAAGLYAIQIASLIGAEVVATDAGRSRQLLHELGADDVLSSAEERFSTADLVFDARSAATFLSTHPRADAPPVPGHAATHWSPDLVVPVVAHGFSSGDPGPQLALVAGLVDAGSLRPIVNETFPLDDVEQALTSAMRTTKPGTTVLIVR